MLGREGFANLTEDMRQQIHDNASPFKAQLRAGFSPFDEEDARGIGIPTLLITGERSAPILHRITAKLQRLMPQAERAQIRNCSHLMYEDGPEAFNQAVLDFLQRHSETSPITT